MSNKKYNEIQIPLNIDTAIDQGGQKAILEKQLKKPKKTGKVIGTVAASVVALLMLGFANPAIAAKIPIIGQIFEKIEKQLYFPGEYSKYATPVNQTVYSNGLTITLSEIVCDGESIYATYIVESDEPFSNRVKESEGELFDVTSLSVQNQYNMVDFTDERLSGINGLTLEGEFIDEYTFVGVQQYDLSSLPVAIPDEFIFRTKMFMVQNNEYGKADEEDAIYGEWAFEVPVKVNKDLKTQFFPEGTEENGAAVKYISVTPFSTKIRVTLPDENFENYELYVYDEFGKLLNTSIKEAYSNYINVNFRSPTEGSESLRIVIEKGAYVPLDKGWNTWQGDDIILDQVISIK